MNANYIAYLQAAKKSQNTINTYTRHIEKCLKAINKDDAQIEYTDLLQYQAAISNHAPASVAGVIAALNSYFDFLVKIKAITENPASELVKPVVRSKEKPYMTEADVKRMIACAYGLRDKAIIRMLATTGLRISELSHLTRADFETAKITHEIKILGKGNKEGVIYLNDTLLAAVQDYLQTRKDNSPWLFVTSFGNKIDEVNITKSIKKVAYRAKLPYAKDVSAHSLRAACATIMSDKGVPVGVISKALRHSSLSVTTRYIRTNQENINKAMASLDF